MLGPSSWDKTCASLLRGGVEAMVARYTVGDPPSYSAVAGEIAAQLVGAGWTVAMHSGAGALAPSIAEAAGGVARWIFVDAILPHPGGSWMGTAPPALGDRLRRLAQGGVVPPWNTWFETDPLAALDPDDRASLERELPELPLAWFELKAPTTSPAWTQRRRCAYLQLIGSYEAEAAACAADGWPVRRRDLGHLGIVTGADIVARELLSLAP